MKRGYTLVEVLVVTGILAILAGLLFPVLKGAKRNGQIIDTTVKLRNIHVATTLYRQDHDGDGHYGGMSSMGLPDGLMLSRMIYSRDPSRFHPMALWQSGCGVHSSLPAGTFVWMPVDDDRLWTLPVTELRDSMVLAFDLNCNDRDVPPESKWVTKLAIGVNLGGSIARLRQTGDPYDPYWWAPRP